MHLLGIFGLRQYAGNIPGRKYLLQIGSASSAFIHIFDTKLHGFVLYFFLFFCRCKIFFCLTDLLSCRNQFIFQFCRF